MISSEFTVVAKCKARFFKKISQLKSDIQSGRCKNFSLKQVSGLIGGLGSPRTLPLSFSNGSRSYAVYKAFERNSYPFEQLELSSLK